MPLSKKLHVILMGVLILLLASLGQALAEHKAKTELEPVWKSNRLMATWFGDNHKIHLDSVHADWIVVKAGRHSDLSVEEITVKYLDRRHHHVKKEKFYPYEQIHHGDKVRFQFKHTRHIVGVSVKVHGESGSRSRDAFRIILKKIVDRTPQPDLVQSRSFYGKCIGGSKCPGYRRHHLHEFSIDLEDEMEIKKIEFFAHDRYGRNHNAKVNVYVDDEQVAENIDIKRRGSINAIELKRVVGRYITFEAAVDDEAMIQQISVDYSEYRGRRHRDRDGRGHHFRRHSQPPRHRR